MEPVVQKWGTISRRGAALIATPFPLLGLSGGIAAGKSFVAAQLQALGWTVIDADALAREAVATGSEGLNEVAAAFGPECLLPDGNLDRAWVAARVFSDRAQRAR